jgi:hypothetical protein
VKVRAFTVTFTREIEITVYAPADATTDEIEAIAATEDVNAYDVPEWEIDVGGGRLHTVPDAECALTVTNKYGHRGPVDGAFRKVDAVVNDARDGFGNPADTDAQWWCLSRDPIQPTFWLHEGHAWAASIAAVVREDVAALVADDWVGELDTATLEGVFQAARTEGFGSSCFDEKYRALLASGVVYGSGFDPHRVVRDGETIAIVMPMRDGAGTVFVAGGLVLPVGGAS